MSEEKYKLIKTVNSFLHWYLGKEYTPKDVLELILTIVAIVFVIFGFLKNKTYYEDVSLEYYPIDTQQYSFPKNIIDEITVGENPDKIVIVSPASVPINIRVMEYKDTDKSRQLIYDYTNVTKKINPGQALKIYYKESESIPNFQLHISTEFGEADVPLIYNGRYGNVNQTKIKSRRKMVPYFLDKLFN